MTPGERAGLAWGLPAQVVHGPRSDVARFAEPCAAQLGRDIHRAAQGEPPVHLIPALAE